MFLDEVFQCPPSLPFLSLANGTGLFLTFRKKICLRESLNQYQYPTALQKNSSAGEACLNDPICTPKEVMNLELDYLVSKISSSTTMLSIRRA